MRRIFGGLAAVAAVAALALASAAPAGATTVSTKYSQTFGGFSAAKGGVDVNEVRTNEVLPNLANVQNASLIAPDSVAVGVVLQAQPNSNGSNDPTLAAAFVWNDNRSGVGQNCPGQWTLEEGAQLESSQNPIPANDLTPVNDGSSPICITSGQVFVGAHWSTLLRQFAVLYSVNEADQTTVYRQSNVFNGLNTFLDAGVGIDTQVGNTTGAATLPNGTTVSFNRVGLTEPAGFNFGGKAGTRVTMNAFTTVRYVGSVLGTGTPADTLTLVPSNTLGVGSAFSILVP